MYKLTNLPYSQPHPNGIVLSIDIQLWKMIFLHCFWQGSYHMVSPVSDFSDIHGCRCYPAQVKAWAILEKLKCKVTTLHEFFLKGLMGEELVYSTAILS